jgi:hypothetical protein
MNQNQQKHGFGLLVETGFLFEGYFIENQLTGYGRLMRV